MSLKQISTYSSFHNQLHQTIKAVLKSDPLNSDEICLELTSDLFPSPATIKEYKCHRKDIWRIKCEEVLKYKAVECLRDHELSIADRAASVNWMIDVITKFKCSNGVFFKTIAILDLFFANSAMYSLSLILRPTRRKDLCVTVSAGIFIASKLSDNNGLGAKTIVDLVGSNQFTESQLKRKEIDILRGIDFDPDLPTCYDIIELFFSDFLCEHNDEPKKMEEYRSLEKLKKSCIYYAVLSCYNYDMLKYK